MTQLDPQARQVLDMMAASGAPPLDQMSATDAREASTAAFTMMTSPKVDVAEARDLSADGPAGKIKLRLYRPAGSTSEQTLPVLVYLHGGGWVICDIETHDQICRRISNDSGCAVVSVDYRLAPEHKFPAAVDDSYAATCWVAQNAKALGVDATRLAVGGDSAGGNLATVVCLMARDGDGPKIKHQLLIYPVTDLAGNTESYTVNGQDYFLTKSLMQWFGAHYLRSEADVADWRASPARAASLKGLPSATVAVCGFDPLRDEGTAYAEMLRKAGVATDLHRYEHQIHGFLLMDGAIAEAQTCMADLGRALRKALG